MAPWSRTAKFEGTMPIILNAGGLTFRPYAYLQESIFEKDVVALSDHIFGPTSIYLNIKKKVGGDIVTIPDGYVIDTTKPDEPKLFVVENEIVSHDPFKHVGIQMLKFVTSFDEGQRAVRTFVMNEIRKDQGLLKRLERACKLSSSPNIDHYLDRAVYSDFKDLTFGTFDPNMTKPGLSSIAAIDALSHLHPLPQCHPRRAAGDLQL
jgi:hypothetical protein